MIKGKGKGGMKKLGLLCVALVVALGSLGVGYGAWTETLNIDGGVTTGTWAAAFSEAVSNDPTGANDPNGAGSWTTLTASPWSATWTGTRENNNATTTVGALGGTTLTITMTASSTISTYDYYPAVAVLVTNTGTVPVNVTASAPLPGAVTLVVKGGILSGTTQALGVGQSKTGYINMKIPQTFSAGTTYTVTLTLAVTTP